MRHNFLLSLLFPLVMGVLGSNVHAGEGTVVGLSPDVDELELYKSPTAEDPTHILGAGDLAFPLPILGVSNNDMYKIRFKDADYWVISDDVKSDVARKIDTACDPKMAGTVVAHGKRGAGEGCQ